MNIPHLNASAYIKTFDSGKTKPALFFCDDEAGLMNGEYVVKMKAGLDDHETGLAFELIAAQLAKSLTVPIPDPAIIVIDPVIAELIPDRQIARQIRESAGLNFGTRFMSGGYSTWPVGMEVPENLRRQAAEIFAFDALIQNTDRGGIKPNVLWKGDELLTIDHEMAFSFVYNVAPPQSPWNVAALGFLKKHIFYRGLQGKELELDGFKTAMKAISTDHLDLIMENVPAEWKSDKTAKVYQHLRAGIEHGEEFIDEVRRFLR